jgi:hypothetical protein
VDLMNPYIAGTFGQVTRFAACRLLRDRGGRGRAGEVPGARGPFVFARRF